MPFEIRCASHTCDPRRIKACKPIDELIWSSLENSKILCPDCHQPTGYVEKSFTLQEKDEGEWKPHIRGAIRLRAGKHSDTYQPFVFIVSDGPDTEIDGFWFSYYKDTRANGGKLKVGHGPGGPPFLKRNDLLLLVRELYRLGYIRPEEIDQIKDQPIENS